MVGIFSQLWVHILQPPLSGESLYSVSFLVVCKKNNFYHIFEQTHTITPFVVDPTMRWYQNSHRKQDIVTLA